MNLRDATAEKHKYVETMPFNKLMMAGQLTEDQYAQYLISQYHIFKTIEKHHALPHPSLNRTGNVTADLVELGITVGFADEATKIYCDYIEGLDQEQANAHIYLNYMALMFGGQMLKEKTPGSGKMYEFDDMNAAAQAIRAIQKDSWANEVNIGFDYIANILNFLYMAHVFNPNVY